MTATPEQLKLISDYEPVLFFHGGDAMVPAERFFPSDAKRYLEHCALWKARAPFSTMADWQNPPPPPRQPAVDAGKLGALPNEGSEFLGKGLPGGPFDYLETPADTECFLEMTGWKPAGTPFPPADRYADLDRLANRYANEPELNNSQFWYHAEFFDFPRLRGLFGDALESGETKFDFMQLTVPHQDKPAFLTDPALICYYLFYPGHDEGLAGCAGVSEAREFASFAGEWTCLAVLLDRPSATEAYAPKWIGLSRRNVGRIQFQGKEQRVGMRIRPWGDMQLLEKTHPRLVVARGSHAFYLPGEKPENVLPLTEPDPSAGSCGVAGPLTGAAHQVDEIHPEAAFGVTIAKMLGGAAVGGLLGPFGALGMLAGFIWALFEREDIPGAVTTTTVVDPPPSLSPTVDSVNVEGKVVHPKGLRPPEVDAGRAEEWRSKDNLSEGGRHYDSTVDRAKQILWPGDSNPAGVLPGDLNPNFKGYTGRWGPRVESDAETRRAGMRFPNFWLIFFDQLVRDNPPTIIRVLTVESGTTWTVPNDWNSSDNTVECLGGGGGGTGSWTDNNVGGSGGGGGAYAKSVNLNLTPGTSVTFNVGAGSAGGPGAASGSSSSSAGGDTWFNSASFPASGQACGAKGASAHTGNSPGTGGLAASSYSTGPSAVTQSGGNGAGGGGTGIGPGGGGGGAAGPSGAGNTGTSGSESTAGTGGTGDAGNTAAGANGTQWDASHGSGGGGNGGNQSTGGDGGLYGGGGGGAVTLRLASEAKAARVAMG